MEHYCQGFLRLSRTKQVYIIAGVRLTGRKMDDKLYHRHTGYMGGLKTTTARKMLDKKPEEVIRLAVKRMLPKNKLGRQQLKKLKIYAGSDHPHQAQLPEPLQI